MTEREWIDQLVRVARHIVDGNAVQVAEEFGVHDDWDSDRALLRAYRRLLDKALADRPAPTTDLATRLQGLAEPNTSSIALQLFSDGSGSIFRVPFLTDIHLPSVKELYDIQPHQNPSEAMDQTEAKRAANAKRVAEIDAEMRRLQEERNKLALPF